MNTLTSMLDRIGRFPLFGTVPIPKIFELDVRSFVLLRNLYLYIL